MSDEYTYADRLQDRAAALSGLRTDIDTIKEDNRRLRALNTELVEALGLYDKAINFCIRYEQNLHSDRCKREADEAITAAQAARHAALAKAKEQADG